MASGGGRDRKLNILHDFFSRVPEISDSTYPSHAQHRHLVCVAKDKPPSKPLPSCWSSHCHLLAGALTVHQLEEVVEDKVLAARVASQLECLAVVHRALLLVDLSHKVSVCTTTQGVSAGIPGAGQ